MKPLATKGQTVTFTVTGKVDYASNNDGSIDIVSDDGRYHSIESPKPSEISVKRQAHPGEVWKASGKLYFIREWNGWNADPDNLKVIPAENTTTAWSVAEFLALFPNAEVVFSP